MHGAGSAGSDDGAESHAVGPKRKHFAVVCKFDETTEVWVQEEAVELDEVPSGVSTVLRTDCKIVQPQMRNKLKTCDKHDKSAAHGCAASVGNSLQRDLLQYKPLECDYAIFRLIGETLANTILTLYPETEEEYKQLKQQFGKISRLDRLVLKIFRGKNDILEYNRCLALADADRLESKELAGMFGVLSKEITNDRRLLCCAKCTTAIQKTKSPHHLVVTWRRCVLQDRRHLMKSHESYFCSRECLLESKKQCFKSHGTLRCDLFAQNARWNRNSLGGAVGYVSGGAVGGAVGGQKQICF